MPKRLTFPDPNFEAALIAAGVDANNDGKISTIEAEAITSMDVSGTFDNPGLITDMTGIEAFTNLTELRCQVNHVSVLDVSNLTNLKRLWCQYNNIPVLDVANLTNLEDLRCVGNSISVLDVANLINLEVLTCGSTAVADVPYGDNNISVLDVANLTNLKKLECRDNNISVLDVANLTNIEELDCRHNSVSVLDVANLTNLERLWCNDNVISVLDVANLTNLKDVDCRDNNISLLDVANLTNLKTLACLNNNISVLDVANLTNLEEMLCHNNPNLWCIKVSDEDAAYANDDWIKDDQAVYTTNLIDTDNDGVCDAADNCDNTPNPEQADSDGNGIGDLCQDTDGDGIIDVDDNCPLVSNADQTNTDNDDLGDSCDEDDDGDGVDDTEDNCPLVRNPDQFDIDNDGMGDACDDQLCIESAIENLKDQINNLLSGGRANSLLVKLTNAMIAWNVGEVSDAIGLLGAFINTVEARFDKRELSQEDADFLILQANIIIQAIKGEGGLTTGCNQNNMRLAPIGNMTTATSEANHVYPNPTSGFVYFQKEQQKITIRNVIGQVLHRAKGTTKIDLVKYKPGIYLIEVYNNEVRSVHRIIKE